VRTDTPITLQGNLEPSALFAPEPELRAQARRLIDRFGTQRYVCNLGHGMLPYHSPESVAILVDEIHKYSEQVNAQNKAKGSASASASAAAPAPASAAAKSDWMSKALFAAAGAVVGAAATWLLASKLGSTSASSGSSK
jgi:hypothetical protein